MNSIISAKNPAPLNGELRKHIESPFEQLADSLPVLIAMADNSLEYFFVNQAFADFYCLEKMQLPGRSIESVIGHEAFADAEFLLREALRGQAVTHEFQRVAPDGRTFVHKASYSPLYDEGSISGVVITSTDITATKSDEIALKKTMNENQAILKAIPDMMFRLNHEGVYVDYYNPRHDELYVSPDNFLGKKIEDVLPVAEAVRAMHFLRLALQTGELTQYTYSLPVNGLVQHFENRLVKIGDQDVLSIVRNITDREASEKTIRLQHDLATSLSKNRDIAQSLKLILHAILSVDGLDCGGIYLVNEENKQLELVSYQGISSGFLEKVKRYGFDSPQFRLVSSRKPLYERFDRLLPNSQTPEERDYIRSLAVLPFEADGRLVGVINLGSRSLYHIPQRIRDQVESLARLSGEAIGRLLAEKALENSRADFKRLFDTVDDLLFILDENGKILHTNQVVETRLGYTAEQLQSLHVLEVHPEGRRDEAAAIVGAMLEGKLLFCPIPLLASNGVLIPVETRVVKGKWNNREVLFGVSRDITERVKSEDALTKKTRELETFFDVAPDLLCISNLEGVLLKVNSAADVLLGYQNGELHGQPLTSFIHPDDVAVLTGTLSDLIKHGEADSYTTRFRHKNGQFLYIEWHSAVMGEQVYSAARDITPHKKIEASLKASISREKELNELKSRFVSMASHEFRTPLASILMSAETLLNYHKRLTENEIAETSGNIVEQTNLLTGIVSEIMQVARAQEGRLKLQFKPTDLTKTIRRTVTWFNDCPNLMQKIEVSTPDEPLMMNLDEQAIIQVLNNLLSNAVKYAQPNPEVKVLLKRGTNWVEIFVADNGIGIPEADQKHLFDPFYRASNVGEIEGNGLGLNIVQELTRLHQGLVEYQSLPGGGSKFRVCFPSTLLCS